MTYHVRTNPTTDSIDGLITMEHSPKDIASLPPIPVCIAGALAIATGVGSAIGMIAGLAGGSFSLDFGFVGIPLGYGILMGRSSSRKWALFFAAAGALLIAWSAGMIIFHYVRSGEKLEYPDSIHTAIGLFLVWACCVYIWIILTRRAYRDWFDTHAETTSAAKSIAWTIAITSTVLLASHHAYQWWVKETHARIYSLRVTITPYHADNGEGINSLSHISDDTTLGNAATDDLTKVGVAVIGSTDGMKLRVSGVATRAVKLTIKSEGFEDTLLTLDQQTRDEIRLAMSPVKSIKDSGPDAE